MTFLPLKGKTAFITGSSRGIGRGIALKLAEFGANIIVHYYKRLNEAEITLNQIEEYKVTTFLVQADVTKPREITSMLQKIRERFTTIDIFVNNARDCKRICVTHL